MVPATIGARFGIGTVAAMASPLARGSAATLELVSTGISFGNQVNLGIKITVSILSTLLSGLHSSNHKPYIYIHIYLVLV